MMDFEPVSTSVEDWPKRSPGPSRRVLGIDIGGANLKFAYQHQTASCSFPMWLESHRLGDRLQSVMDAIADDPEAVAITMTGELADCFATRREGVAHILAQVAKACPENPVFVYAVDGRWLTMQAAKSQPWEVAASNWHALASWIVRSLPMAEGSVDMVVDVGSTTVDVIPVSEGRVATAARTDRQRLQFGQLVYTGYERTPVAAITQQVTVEGELCPLMAERFADSLDAYLALGQLAEDPLNLDTADGRSRTRACARQRLARMVGEDAESLPGGEIESIAMQIIAAQSQSVAHAILRNLTSNLSGRPTIVFCGHGAYLIEQVKQRLGPEAARYIQLEDTLGATASRNASAIAVASQLENALAVGLQV